MGSSNPMPDAPANPYGGLDQAGTGAMSGMSQIAGGPNYAANAYNQYGGGLAGSLQATSYNPQANVSAGDYMMGQGVGMYGQGNQLMNMGLDPQHAYYNQAFQQQQEQTRAGLQARGLNSSPAGQGIENQSNQYFNNLWQNQQAARAAQMAGAAGQMYGQGAANITGGGSLAAGTVGQQYGQLGQQQQFGLASYAQNQQGVQNYLNYLNQGSTYQADMYKAQMAAQAQQQAQDAGMAKGVGSMVGMAAGGMMGGPMGAMAGSSLGGMAGGAMAG
jgi:hypothetical protein